MSAQVYPDLNNYRPQSVCGLVYTRADLLTIGSTLGYQQVIDDFGLHTIRTNHVKRRCFRRRGSRCGVRKRRQIQVISGNRGHESGSDLQLDHRRGGGRAIVSRRKNLVRVDVSASILPGPHVASPATPVAFPSSLYSINVCSLAKAHAKEQPQADLLDYKTDVAIISE